MSVAVQEPQVYRGSELLVALFGALSVVAWTLALLSLENSNHAEAPHITAGDAIPVKVTPVLDTESPLLKGHGKRVRYKMPKNWDPPPQPTPKAPTKPAPGISSKTDPDAPPPEDQDEPDQAEDPKPDSERDGDDGEGGATTDEPGNTDGEGGGKPSDGDGKGGSGPGQGGQGEDPLRARAYSRYLASAQSRFYGGFSCPQTLAETCTATALFTVSGDGTVQSQSFTPCGNPAVDGPAQAAAQASIGKQLPPPPEKYPDFLKSQWSISYRCTAKTN